MKKQDNIDNVNNKVPVKEQELKIFSEEKQKELYEIVKTAFSKDLSYRNCFVLPEVWERIGEELIIKGFGKTNKQQFLSAPNYFRVGYNENNATSISLVGFKDDFNFSLEQICNKEENESNKVYAFKTRIQQAISEGRREYLLEPQVLRTALKLNDLEIWEIIIDSHKGSEYFHRYLPKNLTEWERLVITMDDNIYTVIEDTEFIYHNGMNEDERIAARNFLMINKRKSNSFSSIGRCIEAMCGEKNNLAAYFYLLGLVAGDKNDKNYCFSNYAVFCGKFYPEYFRTEWDRYKDERVNNYNFKYIIWTLFDNKHYDVLIYAFESRPAKVSYNEEVNIYYAYAKAMLNSISVNDLPILSNLSETRRVEIITSYLDILETQSRFEDYCQMLSLCLYNPEQYIKIENLGEYFKTHNNLLTRNFNMLIEHARKGEFNYWLIANYFITNNYIQDKNVIWENFTKEYKEYLKEKILDESSNEAKANWVLIGVMYFPNEKFVDSPFDIIEFHLQEISRERFKNICTNIYVSGNYELLIHIYEHKTKKTTEVWFLDYICRCFIEKGDINRAVSVLLDTIVEQKKLKCNPDANVYQLVNLIYKGIMEGCTIEISKANALLALELIQGIEFSASEMVKLYLFIIEMSITAEETGLYSMFYAMANEDVRRNHEFYFNQVENLIRRCNDGYSRRIGDFVKTYEYILTIEDMSKIMFFTKLFAKILKDENLDYDQTKYWGTSMSEIDPIVITKLVIVDFEQKEVWKLYSKYANDCGKYGLNYTINLILLFKFKDTGKYLKFCLRALDNWIDETLPKNFLINNLLFLNSNLKIDSYWKSFFKHVVENSSFSKISTGIVDSFMKEILRKNKMDAYDCLLVIIILSQINTPAKYYEDLLEGNTVFVRSLLDNPECMIRFLAFFACEDRYLIEHGNRINSLRDRVNIKMLTEKDQAAIRWINLIYDFRNDSKYNEDFFEISREILINYPYEPSGRFIRKKLLKNDSPYVDYNLITNWLNLYDSVKNHVDTYKYLIQNDRPNEIDRRHELYRLQTTILRNIILNYDAVEDKYFYSFLRICKAYLTFKALSNDHNYESESFKQKMFSSFKNKSEISDFKEYEKGLLNFLSKDIMPHIKEEVLYCGITNYWDTFLGNILERTGELNECIDDVLSYISYLDMRPISRRLLQMFLYTEIANIQISGRGTEKVNNIRVKELFEVKTAIESGLFATKQYLANLQKLTNLLCPDIADFISEISSINDMEKKSESLFVLYFVLTNKKWNELAEKLVSEKVELVDKVLIPCICIIQKPKEISQIIEYLAYASNDLTRIFLNSKKIREMLGVFFTNYYYAIYEVKNKRYDIAQEYLNNAGECPTYMVATYEKISKAIANRTDIGSNKIERYEIKSNDIPHLSFMNIKDPEGVNLSQLVMEFYSESGLFDASTKCVIAQKIYYYLLEGLTIRDINNFVYRWGFCAIDCEYNIERKANILFELLDNIYMLEDAQFFKELFVQQFMYILNEYEFHVLKKDFNKIYEHYKRLHAEYQPFDDCLCYAELMVQLARLNVLSTNDIDTNKVIPQIDDIESAILGVHTTYPKNYFARKCIEFVELFKHQIFERGIFEVRILNENNIYNDTVYYQIKNVGFESVSDISVTLYLDGIDKTIRRIKIDDEIPGGLRPNQVFAGEYVPNVFVPEGEKIVCIIQLEYGDKNYIAIDSTSGGTLISKTEEYVYHKSSYSGYLEQTIKSNEQDNFIGRKSELDAIMGGIVTRQNIILYGTNGTGKSSILNRLSTVDIPQYCKDKGIFSITINIIIDEDCTEEQVINRLFDQICDENSTLLAEIQDIERNSEGIDFSDVYYYLNRAIERRKALTIVDKDGVNSANVVELFKYISKALNSAKIRLFLLWDNFEKVISSQYINPKNMRFFRLVGETPEALSNIQFIFSGSNYLLEVVDIEKGDNSWHEILTRCATVRKKIGNLCNDDFYELMSQKQALNNGEIHYSQEAIDYLWKYTNGHAFYSCLLGNKILEILSNRKVKRHCIYPSDIFAAIYKSNKYLFLDGSDTSKEKAIEKQIFQDISNNVAVKYVGKRLAETIVHGAKRMSHNRLKDEVLMSRPDINEISFKEAIDILRARDFIKKVSTSYSENYDDNSNNRIEYSFTSDLYLERFINIYVPELDNKTVNEIERRMLTVKEIVDETQKALTDGVTNGRITVEQLNQARMLLGNNTWNTLNNQGGTISSTNFESGATQTNTNIQVNVQSITNILNGIIDTEDTVQLLNGLHNLPRLSNYLPQLTSGEDDLPVSEERISLAMDSYVAVMEESLEASKEHANVAEDESNLYPYWRILRISAKEYDMFMNQYDIPECFLQSLKFANQLDQLFDKGAISGAVDEIDYSPVTIMYCKLIESMLKEYHISLYETVLPLASTQVKNGQKFYSFGNIKEARTFISGKITIGPFYYAIDYENEKSKISDSAKNNIRSLAKHGPGTIQEWQTHAKALKWIAEIRNSSAHGSKNKRISYQDKKQLLQLLFDEGEFLRIIRISQDKIEW